jgi:pentatricopeptide repeat protein
MVHASSPRLHPLTSKPQPSTFLRPQCPTTKHPSSTAHFKHHTASTMNSWTCTLVVERCTREKTPRPLHHHWLGSFNPFCRQAHCPLRGMWGTFLCSQTVRPNSCNKCTPLDRPYRGPTLNTAFKAFYEEALGLFREMQEQGLRSNEFVIPSTLKACGRVSNRETGEKIHGAVLKCSFESDAFVRSALIDIYSKCGLIEKARRVYDAMVEKDLVALSAMVSGYAQHGFAKEALDLEEKMQALGVKPNVVTWNTP